MFGHLVNVNVKMVAMVVHISGHGGHEGHGGHKGHGSHVGHGGHGQDRQKRQNPHINLAFQVTCVGQRSQFLRCFFSALPEMPMVATMEDKTPWKMKIETFFRCASIS